MTRALIACAALLVGCSATITDPDVDNQPVNPAGEADAGAEPGEWEALLAARKVNYSAALRTAALRLTGELPTLAEIKFVADAADPAPAYRAVIESYLDDPRFARQMVALWRDVFRMGGTPVLDSAPIFAAQLVVENRPFTELFTATSGTCPGFDGETFTAGECANGVATHAGLLTHPGVHAHFASNMAFRRVRWVQETFACTAFPAEIAEPLDVGGAALYTAPWPFDRIAGAVNGGAIDFLDTSAVICANCHATMNRLAPLLGHFDDDGMWSDAIAVRNPTDGQPLTRRTDWLPDDEPLAWRMGAEVADLPGLGRAMAADPAVAECAVARLWNWALGKGDIVDTLAVVPGEVIRDHVLELGASGGLLRPLILDVFTSDDFIRF